MRALTILAGAQLVLGPGPSLAEEPIPGRKSSPEALAVAVTKLELKNGLVVLLSRDPEASRVLVDLTFRAGTLYEPPGRSGLAHLAEHLLMRGPSADTDHERVLEARRATYTNAFTTPHTMVFRTMVPGEELPAALWVAADRMARLPRLIDQASLDRERKIVLVERVERLVEVAYGPAEEELFARLFPAPDPLHGTVAGRPEELASVTLADVQSFAQSLIVPANGVLTVVGAFDEDTARRWLEDTVARIPGGQRAAAPVRPWKPIEPLVIEMPEHRSRRPRVSLVWKVADVTRDVADALDFGAEVLGSYIDGAYGSGVDAHFTDEGEHGVFRLDITTPHEKPMDSTEAEAVAFLRYLTGKDLPRDMFDATRLARDRETMLALDSPAGRAALLTHLELRFGDPGSASKHNARHWRFERHDVQHIAWKTLIVGKKRMVVHARPVRPSQAKPDWEARP